VNVAERRLKLLLRVVGIVSLPAIVAVFMPHSWLVRGVELAESGTPEGTCLLSGPAALGVLCAPGRNDGGLLH